MVDEYYNELEKNLMKIGGLSQEEIGTVVANEMKGIVNYIDTLSKKANRRYWSQSINISTITIHI